MIYKVTLNGKVYEVEVEKGEAVIQAEYEAALPAAAPAAPVAAPAPVQAQAPAAPAASAPAASAGAGTVLSPLPGNINEIRFSAGQTVKAGDVVELRFASGTLKFRVLELRETVKKDDAASLYEVIA